MYKILFEPIEAKDPITVKPMTKPTWKYVVLNHLIGVGIYTDKDLRDLRERIMNPLEHAAILNDMTREIRGQPLADSRGSIYRLLNGKIVQIVESAWDKAWTKFMGFGTVSAGVIAIFFLLHLIKSLLDVLVRGYTLYTVFGWSNHLLEAI